MDQKETLEALAVEEKKVEIEHGHAQVEIVPAVDITNADAVKNEVENEVQENLDLYLELENYENSESFFSSIVT